MSIYEGVDKKGPFIKHGAHGRKIHYKKRMDRNAAISEALQLAPHEAAHRAAEHLQMQQNYQKGLKNPYHLNYTKHGVQFQPVYEDIQKHGTHYKHHYRYGQYGDPYFYDTGKPKTKAAAKKKALAHIGSAMDHRRHRIHFKANIYDNDFY
jgi:hypothetical protein